MASYLKELKIRWQYIKSYFPNDGVSFGKSKFKLYSSVCSTLSRITYQIQARKKCLSRNNPTKKNYYDLRTYALLSNSFCCCHKTSDLLPKYSYSIRYLTNQKTLGRRSFYSDTLYCASDKEARIALRASPFEAVKEKNRETFHTVLESFEARGPDRRGHVEFIYAALKYLEEFGLEKDLETYKKIYNIFPKGRFVAENLFQVEFMHYPKHQQCGVDILDKMEENGVIPDEDIEDMIQATFGGKSFPMRKFARMLYWMPKFRNLSPWPLPKPLPMDSKELAMLALRQMSSVDLQTKINIYQANELEDSLDDTWIISAQSPDQQRLISTIHNDTSVFIEGAFQVYLRNHCINYFVLRIKPRPLPPPPKMEDLDDVSDISLHMFGIEGSKEVLIPPTVHEQEDGIYLALGATGTSSRDSLLSWLRFLQKENPRLLEVPVVFSLKAPMTELMKQENDAIQNKPEEENKPS